MCKTKVEFLGLEFLIILAMFSVSGNSLLAQQMTIEEIMANMHQLVH